MPAEHLSETYGETQGVLRGVGSHGVSVVIDEFTESNWSALGDFFVEQRQSAKTGVVLESREKMM